jgi:5-methylcytosine-specific restriction endonuclease McrA
MIFEYPVQRNERRHGPSGYTSYERYRPWLRDEFDFRCVYCLKREAWGQMTDEFELDHFEPQSINPARRLDYTNLVYACRRCNAVKLDQTVDNPFPLLSWSTIVVASDGSLVAKDVAATRLIHQLDLNSPRLMQWRVMWMRIVALAKERDAGLFSRLVGLPDDLPDLSRLRPPGNHRPKGIDESWFARRSRGDLPQQY